MGKQSGQKEMFSYQVDLDRRVRADHPLRAIRAAIDFGFVREEVAHCYGYNGQVSVDPEVILKLMFLLFLDNVKSERELMRMLPERLDYLWFLGFGLDDEVPDHSVLSKARARWGQAVFESLFVRTVQQCVETGLVEGSKLHLDGSLVDAHASRDLVVKAAPELIAALKAAYQVEERKLEGHTGAPHYEPVNARLCSTTDPDAPCVRNSKVGASGDTRPRYKLHRAVDDRCGVVTATITTPGDIAEPTQTVPLLDQHRQNTGARVATVVGDQQYGTIDNHRALQQRGLRTHLKTTRAGRPRRIGLRRKPSATSPPRTILSVRQGRRFIPAATMPSASTPSISPARASVRPVRCGRDARPPSTAGRCIAIVNMSWSCAPGRRPIVQPPAATTAAGGTWWKAASRNRRTATAASVPAGAACGASRSKTG